MDGHRRYGQTGKTDDPRTMSRARSPHHHYRLIIPVFVAFLGLMLYIGGYVYAIPPTPPPSHVTIDGYMPYTSENTKPVIQPPVKNGFGHRIYNGQTDILSNKLVMGVSVAITAGLIGLLLHLARLLEAKRLKNARILKNIKKHVRVKSVPVKARKAKKSTKTKKVTKRK
jgi:hypothetical protein